MMESKWYTKVLLTMQENISIHISDTFNNFIVISKEIGLELLNIYSSQNLWNHWYNGVVFYQIRKINLGITYWFIQIKSEFRTKDRIPKHFV